MVCFVPPITSVVPSSVRNAVVNGWGHPADSVWKSAFPGAAWPLLVAQKAGTMNIPQEDYLQSRATKSQRRRRNKGMCLEDRPVLEPNAAGIDVGAREMFVAVPPGRDKNPVRVFATSRFLSNEESVPV